MKSKCVVCKKNDVAVKHGCKKQTWNVCDKCFMIDCPECGHEAFWLENRGGTQGRHVCFAVEPLCDWVSQWTGTNETKCKGPDK